MTRAVDTNVLVRWLLGDNEEQTKRANEIVEEGAYVPLTVALEVEWVLRSVFGLPKSIVAEAIERMLRVETLQIDDGEALFWALERYRSGADWADCIHLIGARTATSFATFDHRLARQAGPGSPVPIDTLR